jgi:type I restriction enzyme R subunit
VSKAFAESTVEEASLDLFSGLGYAVLHGPDIAPGELFAERTNYSDVVLVKRLQTALKRINPQIPPEALEDAVRKVLRTETPSLIENNRCLHHNSVSKEILGRGTCCTI